MKKLKEVYGPKGFEILGVANDEPDDLKAYFKKNGKLPWPNIVDPGPVVERFKISAFPTYYIIDKNGKHVATPWGKEAMENEIVKALGIEKIPHK